LHLHTGIYIFYTIFTLLLPLPTTSSLPLVLLHPWAGLVLLPCSLIL
jgi:hypothetical protein